ncbi:hypothetical protein, partial [Desulfogranum japonicum]|uniref:hypothetical protein n=1 Tax=Desulfogranum japonicum TaxID=231447 RepID=UPI001969E35B
LSAVHSLARLFTIQFSKIKASKRPSAPVRVCFSAEAELNMFSFFRQQKSFAFCCLVCDALLSRATERQNTGVGHACQTLFY